MNHLQFTRIRRSRAANARETSKVCSVVALQTTRKRLRTCSRISYPLEACEAKDSRDTAAVPPDTSAAAGWPQPAATAGADWGGAIYDLQLLWLPCARRLCRY